MHCVDGSADYNKFSFGCLYRSLPISPKVSRDAFKSLSYLRLCNGNSHVWKPSYTYLGLGPRVRMEGLFDHMLSGSFVVAKIRHNKLWHLCLDRKQKLGTLNPKRHPGAQPMFFQGPCSSWQFCKVMDGEKQFFLPNRHPRQFRVCGFNRWRIPACCGYPG